MWEHWDPLVQRMLTEMEDWGQCLTKNCSMSWEILTSAELNRGARSTGKQVIVSCLLYVSGQLVSTKHGAHLLRVWTSSGFILSVLWFFIFLRALFCVDYLSLDPLWTWIMNLVDHVSILRHDQVFLLFL